MDIEQDIVIVGAGISGLTASLALHRYGLRSLVVESSECLRTTGYALTLWPNAWRALDAVGVGDHLRQHSVPFRGIQVGSVDTGFPTGELAFEQNKYGKGKHECRRVRRKGLLEALEKELPQGTIRYSSKVVSIEESGHSKLVQLADGCVIRTKVVIGCDGVNSVVAKWLGLPTPISAGRSSIRGFAVYPAGHFFKPNFYIYFGRGVRFGFVPCDDKSINWFCNFNLSNATWHQNMSEEPVKLKAFVLSKIVNIPRELSDIVQRTELGSISCAELKMRLPWHILLRDIAKSSICVAGDALHPMTPDLGQGGCSALEDGVILARCIGESFLKIPRKDVGDGKEDVDPKVVAFKKGVENYAKERRWRSFSLIAAAYAIGFVQASENKFICFLREKFLSMLTVAAVLKMADFDCGNLDIYRQFS